MFLKKLPIGVILYSYPFFLVFAGSIGPLAVRVFETAVLQDIPPYNRGRKPRAIFLQMKKGY